MTASPQVKNQPCASCSSTKIWHFLIKKSKWAMSCSPLSLALVATLKSVSLAWPFSSSRMLSGCEKREREQIIKFILGESDEWAQQNRLEKRERGKSRCSRGPKSVLANKWRLERLSQKRGGGGAVSREWRSTQAQVIGSVQASSILNKVAGQEKSVAEKNVNKLWRTNGGEEEGRKRRERVRTRV